MAPTAITILTIGKHEYHVTLDPNANRLPSSSLAKVARLEGDLIPTTIVEWSKSSFTSADRETTCENFASQDDVWTRNFLSCKSRLIYLRPCQADGSCTVIVLVRPPGILSQVRKKRVVVVEKDVLQLATGPYVVLRATGQIFPVSRIFKDPYQAFTSGIFRKSASSSKWHECHVSTFDSPR
jgi:hypothetical protein